MTSSFQTRSADVNTRRPTSCPSPAKPLEYSCQSSNLSINSITLSGCVFVVFTRRWSRLRAGTLTGDVREAAVCCWKSGDALNVAIQRVARLWNSVTVPNSGKCAQTCCEPTSWSTYMFTCIIMWFKANFAVLNDDYEWACAHLVSFWILPEICECMYSMSIELCHLACTADQEFQFKTLLLAELTKNPQGAMFYLSHAPAGGAKCLTWCMNSYITRATSYR